MSPLIETSAGLLHPSVLLVSATLIVLAVHIIAWLLDLKGLRYLPGPPLAKLSNAWLGWAGHTSRVNAILHEQHMKYGKVVRVAPNHVSIADPDALHAIYGFTNGTLKSDFYDALLQFGGTPSIFTTRSQQDHSRKRKFVAHALSMRSVLEFEPTIAKYQALLVDRWDQMCHDAAKGKRGRIGAQVWTSEDGRAWFDCMPWLNFESFDVIGESTRDLAFGSGFGLLKNGTDVVSIAKSQEAAIKSFDSKESVLETKEIPVVQVVLNRSEHTTASAFVPAWIRPLLLLVPSHIRGSKAMEAFGTIAVTGVTKRLQMPSDKVDLLSKMVEIKDDGGRPMGSQELCAESTLLLIAGSDTTANTSCATIFYLARDEERKRILQQELDAALGLPNSFDSYEGYGKLYEKVKDLPYLEAVINETLRVYSTVGVGLPRVVPKGGMTVLGHTFTEGTIVSVPLYTLHRDPQIWGPDPENFRPERWLVEDKSAMQKAFAPFQIGPRACVGRNLALVRMTTLLAILLHRYDFVLKNPQQKLDVHEGLIRKPLRSMVGMTRRGSRA